MILENLFIRICDENKFAKLMVVFNVYALISLYDSVIDKKGGCDRYTT